MVEATFVTYLESNHFVGVLKGGHGFRPSTHLTGINEDGTVLICNVATLKALKDLPGLRFQMFFGLGGTLCFILFHNLPQVSDLARTFLICGIQAIPLTPIPTFFSGMTSTLYYKRRCLKK